MSASFVRGILACLFAIALTASTVIADEPQDLNKIPTVVMKALKVKFPKAKIEKWTKEKEDEKEVYDIEFKHDGKKTEADIFADGTFHNWEQEFPVKDLPKAVTDAAQMKYPKCTYKEVMKITEVKDGKDVDGGFELVLVTTEKKEVEMTVSSDGKILEASAP